MIDMIQTILNQVAAQPENMWDVTIGPYTDLIGAFFWVVLLFLMVILVWMKTQSFGPTFFTIIVGLVVLSQLGQMPGEVYTLFIFAIAIGIAYTFYLLLVRKKSP